jgi:hypothetical protein
VSIERSLYRCEDDADTTVGVKTGHVTKKAAPVKVKPEVLDEDILGFGTEDQVEDDGSNSRYTFSAKEGSEEV